MLIFILDKMFSIIIGRVPAEKQGAVKEAFWKFLEVLVESGAKGMSEGAVEGMKGKYGSGKVSF